MTELTPEQEEVLQEQGGQWILDIIADKDLEISFLRSKIDQLEHEI